MYINEETCTACGECIPYCTVAAISLNEETAEIDYDECVECSICVRLNICPTNSITRDNLVWPRTVRNAMSDVLAMHKITGLGGRGTEEMKTNDVTGRYKEGFVGVAIEFGRPALGARFYDIEKITKASTEFGVEFEGDNPISALMSNKVTGEFPEELLNEKILTGIVEFIIEEKHLNDYLEVLKTVSQKIDSVFSLGLMVKCDDYGRIPDSISELDVDFYLNGKTCVGLGRKNKEAK